MRPSKRMRAEQEGRDDDLTQIIPPSVGVSEDKEVEKTVQQVADDLFDVAVKRIANAAKQFKQVIGDEKDETPSYMSANEENPYSAKLPAGAYCLRLAHTIWRDTRVEAKRDASGAYEDDDCDDDDCPVHRPGHRKGVAFAGMASMDSPELTPVTPEVAISSIAEELTVEQRNNLIAAFQKMNADETSAAKAKDESPPPKGAQDAVSPDEFAGRPLRDEGSVGFSVRSPCLSPKKPS